MKDDFSTIVHTKEVPDDFEEGFDSTMHNRPLQLLTILLVFVWIVTAIAPINRLQWLLENMLPVATVLTLVFTYRKFSFSNTSYALLFFFLCLHLYAAHYTYQGTPFDVWLKASFHTQRSYFDRVVHLMFGLLLAYPLREFLKRVAGISGLWSYALPAAVIFSFSALFEIMEMIVALLGGQAGQDYLGLQGDIYDTQKDMALGLVGGILAMGIVAGHNKRKQR